MHVYLKQCQERWIDINILFLHLTCKGGNIYVCVAKMLLFLSATCVFHVAQLM